jgi:hypothetical protein
MKNKQWERVLEIAQEKHFSGKDLAKFAKKITGKESSKDFTYEDAEKFISALEKMPANEPFKGTPYEDK